MISHPGASVVTHVSEQPTPASLERAEICQLVLSGEGGGGGGVGDLEEVFCLFSRG